MGKLSTQVWWDKGVGIVARDWFIVLNKPGYVIDIHSISHSISHLIKSVTYVMNSIKTSADHKIFYGGTMVNLILSSTTPPSYRYCLAFTQTRYPEARRFNCCLLCLKETTFTQYGVIIDFSTPRE